MRLRSERSTRVHREAVDRRHRDVEHEEVGRRRPRSGEVLQRLGAVLHGIDVVALERQGAHERRPHGAIVLGDEQSHAASTPDRGKCAVRAPARVSENRRPVPCRTHATRPPFRGPSRHPRRARRPAGARHQPALGVGPRARPPVRADLAGLDAPATPTRREMVRTTSSERLAGARQRPERSSTTSARCQAPPRDGDQGPDVVRRPGRQRRSRTVAYFSPEFGITEALPQYSGGLGVLAGDHLKASSDLGVPLVGVGLLYTEGYFRQRLDADGWQQERRRRLRPASRSASPTPASRSPSTSPATPVHGPRLAGRRRPHPALPARHRRRRATRPTASPSPTASTAATSTTGCARRSILGIGGVRALRALGIAARRVPHERGPRRVPRPGADPRARRRRAVVRRGHRGRPRRRRVHDAHARAGRHRPLPAAS